MNATWVGLGGYQWRTLVGGVRAHLVPQDPSRLVAGPDYRPLCESVHGTFRIRKTEPLCKLCVGRARKARPA